MIEGIPIELYYALGAAGMAFVPWARREILKRDGFTCQADKCFGEYLGIGKLGWKNGFMIQAAHYPEEHQPFPDSETSRGRVLCTTDHLLEEMTRRNWGGASLMWMGQTIRSKEWLEQHGYDFQNDKNLCMATMKMGFEWYVDFMEADEQGKIGLAEAYKDRYAYELGLYE